MSTGTRAPDPEPTASVEEMWVDGVWAGPRSLRFFLRVNRVFFGVWLLVVCGIALAFWVDGSGVPSWSAPLLAIVTGTGVTVAFMFCFSRGWVREGD
jgi:hypothetical protein